MFLQPLRHADLRQVRRSWCTWGYIFHIHGWDEIFSAFGLWPSSCCICASSLQCKVKIRLCVTVSVKFCSHSSKKTDLCLRKSAFQSHLLPKSSSCRWWPHTSAPQQYLSPKQEPLTCARPQNKCSWVVPVNKTSTPLHAGYRRQVPLRGGCWKIKPCSDAGICLSKGPAYVLQIENK